MAYLEEMTPEKKTELFQTCSVVTSEIRRKKFLILSASISNTVLPFLGPLPGRQESRHWHHRYPDMAGGVSS